MSKKNLMGASALIAAAALASGAHATTGPTYNATGTIYGEGSTLIGPYLDLVAACFGSYTPLAVQAGSSPSYTVTATALTPFTACTTSPTTASIYYLQAGSGNGQLGAMTHDLTVDASNQTTNWGTTTVGSTTYTIPVFTGIQFGAGDYGIGFHDVQAYTNGGLLSQTTGASPAQCVYFSTTSTSTPDTGNSCSSKSSGTPVTYANPVSTYGAFIQVPVSIDAVSLAYSPTYKIVNNSLTGANVYYHFNVQKPNADKSGGLKLSMPVVCAIFNGTITNWNDPALTALNGGVSLMDPTDPAYVAPPKGTKTTGWVPPTSKFSVPISLVGRSDGSGTTSIFYRALAAQCGTSTTSSALASVTVTVPAYTNAATTFASVSAGVETLTWTQNYLTSGSSSLPSSVLNSASSAAGSGGLTFGAGTASPGLFNAYKGSNLVAKVIGTLPTVASGGTATKGEFGYIGADYTLPVSGTTVSFANAANNYMLNQADLATNAGTASETSVPTTFIEPTAATATLAFGSILPPQSTATGAFTTTPSSTSNGLRTSPSDWVLPKSTTVQYTTAPGVLSTTAVANPLAVPANPKAYPLVGTTQVFLSTCYQASNFPTVQQFFNYYFSSTVVEGANGVLHGAGFGILPTAWRNAILETFFGYNGTSYATTALTTKTATTGAATTGHTTTYTYSGPASLNLTVLPAGTTALKATVTSAGTKSGTAGSTLGDTGGQCATATGA